MDKNNGAVRALAVGSRFLPQEKFDVALAGPVFLAGNSGVFCSLVHEFPNKKLVIREDKKSGVSEGNVSLGYGTAPVKPRMRHI